MKKEQIIEVLWRWSFRKGSSDPLIRFNDAEAIASELAKDETEQKPQETAEEIHKIISITDCMECPIINKCHAWKSLTPKQRFTLKTGVGIGKFILKNCPLDNASQFQKPAKEITDEEINEKATKKAAVHSNLGYYEGYYDGAKAMRDNEIR